MGNMISYLYEHSDVYMETDEEAYPEVSSETKREETEVKQEKADDEANLDMMASDCNHNMGKSESNDSFYSANCNEPWSRSGELVVLPTNQVFDVNSTLQVPQHKTNPGFDVDSTLQLPQHKTYPGTIVPPSRYAKKFHGRIILVYDNTTYTTDESKVEVNMVFGWLKSLITRDFASQLNRYKKIFNDISEMAEKYETLRASGIAEYLDPSEITGNYTKITADFQMEFDYTKSAFLPIYKAVKGNSKVLDFVYKIDTMCEEFIRVYEKHAKFLSQFELNGDMTTDSEPVLNLNDPNAIAVIRDLIILFTDVLRLFDQRFLHTAKKELAKVPEGVLVNKCSTNIKFNANQSPKSPYTKPTPRRISERFPSYKSDL